MTREALDHARLARVLAQHAESALAMGVDAVPRSDVVSTPSAELAASVAPSAPSEFPLEQPVSRVASGDSSAAASGDSSAVASGADSTRAPKSFDRVASQARLDELRARYEREAPHKGFVTEYTNIVFGDGDPCARLVFVGEAPGADEDRTGVPFVGRAGKLLDTMIQAMGLSRAEVYICNVLKTRPVDNATPTTDEIRLCAPYLHEQLAILAPEVIVTLGLPASRALLQSTETMGRLRGRWWSFTDPAGHQIAVMPTYHPAFLLRSYTVENRQMVWSDLQQVMGRLGMKSKS